MNKRYKPKWLYEALPYLYLGGGACSLLGIGNLGGVLSSLLLMSAGGVIWKMRRDYRLNQLADKLGGPITRGGGKSLVQMVWHPAFEVGHELIDRQHRRLFATGNELIDAIMRRQSKDDIELMLDDLVNDIAEHFRCEEDAMASLGRQMSAAHLQAHRHLLAEVTALREKFQRGDAQMGELVGFIAYDVIAQHLVKDDVESSSG